MSTNTAKKYGRTYKKAAAIPYGTTVEDANGDELVREEDGWELLLEDPEAEAPWPIGTTDLSFPVRVILEQSGDRKARGGDRKARRERGRLKAKARAKKVLRQVHAAEEEREASRREALRPTDDALPTTADGILIHDEEVGA